MIFHTWVLVRHLQCLVRGPLSRSISKPILLADSPNMYLQLYYKLNRMQEEDQMSTLRQKVQFIFKTSDEYDKIS